MTKSIEIQIGDMHIGHKTAIMYPDSDLDYKPNKAQRWLFRVWDQNFLTDLQRLLDKFNPDHVHLSTMGDMGERDVKNRARDYVWARKNTAIVDNATKLLRPLIALVDHIHAVRGTMAHIGSDGGIDEAIAAQYGDTISPTSGAVIEKGIVIRSEEGLYAHWYAEFELSGVRFDIAHHGKNRTKWTDINGLVSLGNEILLRRTKNRIRVPDVVSRGHYHWSGHTPMDMLPYVVAVPSWQLPTEYVYRIDPTTETPIVGAHVIAVEDGRLVWGERLTYTYPRGRVWKQK